MGCAIVAMVVTTTPPVIHTWPTRRSNKEVIKIFKCILYFCLLDPPLLLIIIFVYFHPVQFSFQIENDVYGKSLETLAAIN